MKIKTICRKDRINAQGKVPIILEFSQHRQIHRRSTGIFVNATDWDWRNHCLKQECVYKESVNLKLATLLLQYKQKITQMEILGIPITFENLLGQTVRQRLVTVDDFFKQLIKRFEVLEQYGSAENYRSTLSLMRQFHSTNIYFGDIDLNYLMKFESFLKARGSKSNSIATKFSRLKSAYNKAIAEDIFTPEKNPFQQFKVGRLWKNTQKRAITKEDIHQLMSLDLSARSYYTRFSRDIFIFSYLMAGINFKDIALLKWANIVNGRIYYNRKKTGKVMTYKGIFL